MPLFISIDGAIFNLRTSCILKKLENIRFLWKIEIQYKYRRPIMRRNNVLTLWQAANAKMMLQEYYSDR